MQKIISSGQSAMDKIKQGVDLVANPVKSTISPNGRTVVICESFVSDYNTHYKPIAVTKDGYRVSQSISSTLPEVQAGVLMIQQACAKQMADAGDATSTCALLTQALLDGGLGLVKEGVNPIEIVKGINAAVEYVVEELKKMSTPINGDVEKIRQVATVCSNNDTVIGNLIAEAFEKTGVDGIINIEEAKGRETSIKISDGIKFGRGWASQYFITDKAKAECVLEKPFILIYDRPLIQLEDKSTGSSLMPVLERILQHQQQTGEKRPLMIFCDACDGEALATLTFNTNKGALQSCVVEMAFLGQHKREFMEDIAAATGGVFINELKGKKLDSIALSDFGQAQKVIVGKDETVIIGGLKDEKIFSAHAKSIKDLEEKEEDGELKELLKKRYARLNGAVAILSVGATTEVEMKEKKDRVDDAVRSTRCALQEGFVPGGGTAFLRVPLPIVKEDNESGIMKGYNIVFNALQKSLEQICVNGGVDSKPIIIEVLGGEYYNIGYNAKTGKIEDLVESGVIEPTKSNRCALQNAASVVNQILLSQFLIVDTL